MKQQEAGLLTTLASSTNVATLYDVLAEAR